MFLQCKKCLEPRDVYATNCRKCGAPLPKVVPCARCNGVGYIKGLDGPEDCPDCEGYGGR